MNKPLNLTTMKNSVIIAIVLLIAINITSCSKRKVSRVDPVTQTDLSGRWNETDSRLVAQEMISDVMSRPWLIRFEEKHNRPPVVIVGLIQNKTHEHIDTETFIRNMEREFVNNGRIRVVQSAEFRDRLRAERADQQEFASQETQSRWGRELGADYMINGNISSITDAHGKERSVYYQINLELNDLETNEKVWIGEKQIKKLIKN